MSSRFRTVTPLDDPNYQQLLGNSAEIVWPPFMLEDPVSDVYWGGLYSNFAAYQFALIDREREALAGFANSAPLAWHGSLDDLPDDGWDWAMAQSSTDFDKAIAPNALFGIQIAVMPDYQGMGLSGHMLQIMVDVAKEHSLTRVLIAVRPSMKHLYPLTPMHRYITWMREDGLPYDAWLRVHVRNGGRIIKPCNAAMRIPGTVSQWEEWTSMRFFESGDYVVPGALTPVYIDTDEDEGVYIEPNVWIVHDVSEA